MEIYLVVYKYFLRYINKRMLNYLLQQKLYYQSQREMDVACGGTLDTAGHSIYRLKSYISDL